MDEQMSEMVIFLWGRGRCPEGGGVPGCYRRTCDFNSIDRYWQERTVCWARNVETTETNT